MPTRSTPMSCWSRGGTISAKAPPAPRSRTSASCWACTKASALARWPMPDLPYGGYGPIFSLNGVTPTIAPDAFIAPTAAVIGDVTVGAETGIWFHCMVRGDLNSIRIGARTNIQDATVIHVDTGAFSTFIGDDVTVGHNAVIHACTLKNRA